MGDTHLITGAFSYSGKYIAKRLMDKGISIRTMTGKVVEANQGIEVFPYSFEDFDRQVDILKGVSVVYNTYWVRFSYGNKTYDLAVENTKKLIKASVAAGVSRFVHVSITNPSNNSNLPYFRGKAILEDALKQSALSYAILRPTVLFGLEDILINNIAWMLRRFPVFGMIGDGKYGIQPVYVDDLAELAVNAGATDANIIVDAVGPETFDFRDLVAIIRKAVHSKSLIIPLPPEAALVLSRVLGKMTGDVVLTHDEVKGLMSGLLVSSNESVCHTRLTDWIIDNGCYLGRQYSSEIERHYR